jgi:ElaB/YqjD/DUF883 family membrane-anchored ribosome-binding protein
MSTSETHTARDRLFEDFKTIVTDAEELLKATAGQSGEKIDSARARTEENLRRARAKLNEMEGDVVDRTRAAAKATDQLVHENPWQSIALATAVGFVVGMMTGRR